MLSFHCRASAHAVRTCAITLNAYEYPWKKVIERNVGEMHRKYTTIVQKNYDHKVEYIQVEYDSN